MNPEEIKAFFSEIKGLVAGKADAAETKSIGERLESLAQKIEAAAYADEYKALGEQLAAAEKRIDELETEAKAHGASGFSGAEAKSWAEVVHAAEVYKRQWSGKSIGALNASGVVEVPSLVFTSDMYPDLARSRGIEAKAAPVVHDSTLLGAWSVPRYRSELVEVRERRLGFLSLVRVVDGSGAESYVFKRETSTSGRGYWHATITGDTAAGSASLTFDTVDGLAVGAAVRLHSTDSSDEGTYVVYVDTINTSTLAVAFKDADGVAITTPAAVDDGDRVTSEVYGATAESADKPYGFLEVESVTENMKTIATLLAITQQRLNAIPRLQAWAESKMRRRFRQVLTWHVLYGDGTLSAQLSGLWNATNANTRAWSEGSVGDNRIDVLLRAAEDVEAEGFTDISIAMNPRDWGKIRRLKDGDGNYLSQQGVVSIRANGGLAIDRYPVILDDVIREGEAIVGAFDEACELVDQGSAAFAVGYVNDQFRRNEITARYEETLAHAILTTDAYVLVTFDQAPTA